LKKQAEFQKSRLSNWSGILSKSEGVMIEVRTCARLHLGLLDNNGGQGRLYGSIGLAVNYPSLLLRAETADRLLVEGLERDRITTYAQRFIDRYGVPTGAHLSLLNSIPAHVGLGSGTQLGLAVGAALARLAGLRIRTEEIALAVGRGLHSGIGIATFRHGGFVLDGGRRIISEPPDSSSGRQIDKSKAPPVIINYPMPKDWFFVIAIPEADPGLSGEKENRAFLQLPEAPARLVERISWVLLMKMLPALVEKDIANFGQALTGIQYMVGDCFASVQDGRFANPFSEKVVHFLLDSGAAGVGQSSWGPTVYGLVQGRNPARELAKKVQKFMAGMGGGKIFCVQPHNRGAGVRVLNRSDSKDGYEKNSHSAGQR
jgi:beta-ribofuranosylaminobenzene 5'-phosphate synthase